MATSRFDRDKLIQEFEEKALRKQQSLEVAHDLLLDFPAMARELGVEPQVIDPGSMAAKASGIALAKWPKGADGYLRYYPLITQSKFDFWLAAESQGLSITPDGEIFLKGESVTVVNSATWLASVSGYDPDRVQGLLEDALRGKPAQV